MSNAVKNKLFLISLLHVSFLVHASENNAPSAASGAAATGSPQRTSLQLRNTDVQQRALHDRDILHRRALRNQRKASIVHRLESLELRLKAENTFLDTTKIHKNALTKRAAQQAGTTQMNTVEMASELLTLRLQESELQKKINALNAERQRVSMELEELEKESNGAR